MAWDVYCYPVVTEDLPFDSSGMRAHRLNIKWIDRNHMKNLDLSESSTLRNLGTCLGAAIIGLTASVVSASETVEVESDQLDRVPSIYVIPMEGQMGTDVHPSIYEDLIKDVEKVNPDIVIYRLKAADIDEIYYRANDDRREAGMVLIEEYRDLVKDLHEKIEARQVMWVEDSVGIASLFALSWPEMYMGEDARLWGLEMLSKMAGGWSDADVASKMLNAWVGIGNGFLQKGEYPLEIGWAMMRPEYTLSAKFKGREVSWANDTRGHWVVDSSDKSVARFDNTLAEEMGLSKGTASSLEDLVFLLGYREYEEIPNGVEMHEKYVEDWRRTFDRTRDWWRDYVQKRGWANGQDAVKFLGGAKNDLERIIRAMRTYPAVEARWKTDFGVTRMELEIMVEQLKEQIGGMRNRGRNGGSRGGGRGGGRGPGGGGLGG